MSALILDSEIVHYEVLGRGRPLFFLHGWVGSWRYWIPTMQATSIAFRSYAIDLWGFGDTAKYKGRYTLEAQVQLLDNFLAEMGIGKIALVGHGLGALVSMLYAEKFPRFVDRVMVVGYPLETDAVSDRLGMASPTELGQWLLSNTPNADAAQSETSKADAEAIVTSLENLKTNNLHNLPSSLSIPCLFVHGQNDPAISTPTAGTVSEMPAHAHYMVFQESGHFPMLDQPSQFNRLLTDFLKLGPGETPQNLQLKEEWKRRYR